MISRGGIRTGITCTGKKTKPFIPQQHQQKVLDYFLKSDYRGLLLYHKLGSGKTCTSILVSDTFLNKSKDYKKVYVLTPGSLRSNFIEEYCLVCGKDQINKYTFITYNTNVAPNLPSDFSSSIIIIDEFHNLIRGALNKSKNLYAIYEKLIHSKNCKILLLSGTPVFSKPEELGVLLNILLPGEFKSVIQKDKKENYSDEILEYINNKPEQLINKIQGIVSYVGDKLGVENFPTLIEQEPIKIQMSKYQDTLYHDLYVTEQLMIASIPNKLKKLNPFSSEYKLWHTLLIMAKKNIMSKSCSNVAYPKFIYKNRYEVRQIAQEKKDKEEYNINDTYAGIALLFKEEGDTKKKKMKTFKDVFNSIVPIEKEPEPVESEDQTVSFIEDKSLENGGWIEKNGMIGEHYSPKIKTLMNNIETHFYGKHVIYSFYKTFGGVNFISTLLSMCGIKHLVYSGDIGSDILRAKVLKKFNDENNKYGEFYKVILLTDAGAEGITLKSVRHLHILESMGSENKSRQLIGRISRFKSHEQLPLDERNVNVWRYWSISSSAESIDEVLYLRAKSKIQEVDKVSNILIDASIENNDLI